MEGIEKYLGILQKPNNSIVLKLNTYEDRIQIGSNSVKYTPSVEETIKYQGNIPKEVVMEKGIPITQVDLHIQELVKNIPQKYR